MAQADLPELEQRLLLDAAFYEELTFVEDELIDEYLRAELSPSDRESFESHFMSAPERREKLRFARALEKHIRASEAAQPLKNFAEGPNKTRTFFSLPSFQNPILSYALVAAVLLLVAAISWMVWKNSRTAAPSGEVLAVTLTPGVIRGDDQAVKEIIIPARVATVLLQLQIESANQYPRYRADLYAADGGKTFEAHDLIPAPTGTNVAVNMQVAARVLAKGDYYIKLSGLTPDNQYESVGRYAFRVMTN